MAVREVLKRIPAVGPALVSSKRGIEAFVERRRFTTSGDYWERRYAANGDSGDGSKGLLAAYKAEFLNDFVGRRRVQSVIEFGCGDGQQLALAEYPTYVGLDVAPTAIDLCLERFRHDPAKSFLRYDPERWVNHGAVTAELALSLDVIYHLVEDEVFHRYIAQLFEAASRFVIIYSSNENSDVAAHVLFRKFTPFVESTQPTWRLTDEVPNPHARHSPSRFFVYEKN